MELIYGAVTEQVCNCVRGDTINAVTFLGLRLIYNPSFPVPTVQVLPLCLAWEVGPAESESLFAEEEPVRMRVGKNKAIVVSAPYRSAF